VHRFFSSHRTLDRPGVDRQVKVRSQSLCQRTCSDRLAGNKALFDERQGRSLEFMGTTGTTLARD
jgi:hypothetical protein